MWLRKGGKDLFLLVLLSTNDVLFQNNVLKVSLPKIDKQWPYDQKCSMNNKIHEIIYLSKILLPLICSI